MLKKPYRLTESSRFAELRHKGKSYAHPLVVLVLLPNEKDVTRFGFTAGKRLGNAVQRNRAKRRLREAVRRRLPEVIAGIDVMLIARERIRIASFDEVQEAVDVLMRRAGMLGSA
jgi:ribonuclease P protein component